MSADCVVIAALDEDRVIGDGGAIPWHIPDDLRRFRDLTMDSPVVVGRKTFETMPPLDGRETIVLTRSALSPATSTPDAPAHRADSIRAAVAKAEGLADGEYFVAGGASIYRQFLGQGLVDRMELTLVEGSHGGDARFPEWDDADWSREYLEQCNGYRHVTLESR